jgi:endonuclease IV
MLGVHLREPHKNKINVEYIQFFVVGPQNYTTVEWLNTREKRAAFRRDPRKKIVHGSYVDYPWGGNKVAVYNIKRELQICKEIGAIGLVVHIPSDVKKIAAIIDKLLDGKPSKVDLILEVNARGGWTPPELNKVLQIVRRRKGVGVCIDTAHLWSAGIRLTTAEQVQEWARGLCDKKLIKLVHLNDNRNPLGGRRDIHDPLIPGVGQIWRYNNSGLREVLRQFTHAPMILERDANNDKLDKELKYVRGLLNGKK